MDQVTARFKERLFSSPDEIRIMDQLAEWNRQNLGARYASAQLYNPRSRHLHVVAQREFTPALIGQFQDLPLTSGTMCARAGRLQRPILVPDVTADSDWTPFLSFSEVAGFGGVLSIPLLSRTGDLIGVTSCHFPGHAKPTEKEMNFARVSCQFASDAIAELRRRQRQ